MSAISISSKAYKTFRAHMKAQWQAAGAPCWMDGQPINYDGEAFQPDSFELDHAEPRSKRPDLILDPANARPSHARCNRARQAGDVRPMLGSTSEAW